MIPRPTALRKACLFLMALAVLASSVFMASPASAALAINPTMVVIEGRARYADITLINTGDRVTTYTMGWRFFRMEEGTGAYQEVDAATTDFDLSQHLAFSPRRITLMPKVAQRVRLALRLNGEPPAPGDYRAHFELKEMPDNGAQGDGVPAPDRATIGVRINVGFSLPVVYRVGEAPSRASIGDISVRNNARTGRIEVVVPVTRQSGPYGTLGRLSVYHRTEAGEKLVGNISNANIFPEVNRRDFAVSLNVKSLTGGSLRVVYTDFRQDRNIVFDEKTVPIR